MKTIVSDLRKFSRKVKAELLEHWMQMRVVLFLVYYRIKYRKKPPTSQWFCRKPFQWLEPEANGKTYLCCSNWLPISIGKWSKRSPKRKWNSWVAQGIRASIHDGSFRFCDASRCPSLQQKTFDVVAVSRLKIDNPSLVPLVEEKQLKIETWNSVNLSADPTCNLACGSCRSSKILAPYFDVSRLHAEIQKDLASLKGLHLTGSGDPFASQTVWKFLTSIEGEKFSGLSISLYTNGLLFSEERWKALIRVQKNIRNVHVSVDAASPFTYGVNRGGDFYLLKERLKFISTLPVENFTISMVVQANNFREMPRFSELASEVNAHQALFSKLENWGTYADGEYRNRAIHLADHPRHEEFIQLLSQPGLYNRLSNFGNLSSLRR